MGGNLDLVKWLVDAHGCPLSVKRNPVSGVLQSIQTSNSRTLMDLAMTGRPKIDILQYLVSKNLSISDTSDASLASKTLEALMRPGNKSFDALTSTGSGCDESVSTVDDAVSEIMNCNITGLSSSFSTTNFWLNFSSSLHLYVVHHLLRKT